MSAAPDTLPADNLSKEIIVGQQPDLVITWGFDETTPEELAEVGIPTLEISGYCIDEGGPQSDGDFGTLARLFVAETGMTFGRWRSHARLAASLPLLAAGTSVSTAAHHVGYATPSAFVAAFHRQIGTTPAHCFSSR